MNKSHDTDCATVREHRRDVKYQQRRNAKYHRPAASDGGDITLQISEGCARQMMEMAIELYAKNPGDPAFIAGLVISSTKEMVRRGNLRNGYIVGSNEMEGCRD